MSIFGKIASAIFGIHPAAAAEADTVPAAKPASGGAPATMAPAPNTATAAAAANPTAPVSTTAAATGAPAKVVVDVASVLDGIKAKQSEALDWRKSIVDLMKLLKLDSSLAARKELAAELHYAGDTSDSAAMNVWLHKQVMVKLAENGGIVPADLKH